MNKWITSLFATAIISGCATVPTLPEPHQEKYTFQVISIEIPDFSPQVPFPDAEELINSPDAQIIEYPIVISGLGESVTNDQTKSVSLAEDFTVVNGKAVADEKKHKLGYVVSITVNEIENGTVSYHLNAHYEQLVGYDKYNIENGISVKMPLTETHSIDTNLKQKANTWVLLGGLVDERSDGNKMTRFYGARIIPPIADK